MLHTLTSLSEHLCPDLVDVAYLPPDADDIVIEGFHLPETGEFGPDGSPTRLLLAVRCEVPAELIESLGRLSGYGAVIAGGAAVDDVAIEVARARHVGLMVLRRDVSWMHLMSTLYNLLDEGERSRDIAQAVIPGPEDDLFEIADWVATQLGAPVTIEDPRSRVIAFSSHVGPVDAARVESIMRREVPRQYLDRMRKHGVFQRLAAATSPVFVGGRRPDIEPRVAMPVRAGRELLGSIWVAAGEPLPPAHERVLTDSAAVVAVHLLRRRQFMGYERRIHTDAVRHLLAGRTDKVPELSWLSESGGDLLVLATTLADDSSDRDDTQWERHAVTDAVRGHLLAIVPGSVTGLVDTTTYSVIRLTGPSSSALAALRQSMADFVNGFTRHGRHHPLHIGIGTRVPRARDLAESREMADLAVETLAQSARVNEVATIEEVGAQALLLRNRKAISRSPGLGGAAVSRIRAYDNEHGTLLADTLYAWLRAHGRFDTAAQQLHLHPNTVRYRVRQLRELHLIDLDDPAERFAAYAHLSTRD